ncbi:AI-2E family transporter [Faunimonas sp. B44]|uniref:AI-2E family transporter n=1 Tax=Faunimonas sp. B44 TaxID=3461493 RepID=UPI0040442AF1
MAAWRNKEPAATGAARMIAAPRLGPRQGAAPLLAMAAAVAVLYFARDVFLPLAIAVLLTFALAPVVSMIRRTGLPRVPAVIIAVAAAFLVISAFSFLVATQVAELARNVPTYQSNILAKVQALKESGGEDGVIRRITEAVERVGQEIKEADEGAEPAAGAAEPRPDPLLVEIYAPEEPIQVLTSMIVPLLGPLATAGLVVVVVIFMLLEREDLRDRFIRLAGSGDLHRTTEALQDAGKRVGQYLLMQLVVNVTYGVPIGIGLWLIGIPNAMLWGLLAIVLRFVPYIGPVIAMVLPLFLAVAVAPGWSLVLWAAGLFLVMELISNNFVEPWLYGSRTGLSPLAIIVAAIFWTWLWGPVGLVLSTPLTVCLVVLGKHVPQFEFFEVLFGSEPVLDPKARLYQRLLAGDPEEATDQAEELLEEDYLIDYYRKVAIPAMILAERDRARGVMGEEQKHQVSASALALVSNLQEIADEELDDGDEVVTEPDEEGEDGREALWDGVLIPDGTGKSLLCIGGRGALDDVTAAMLAQVLRAQGAAATEASYADLEPSRLRLIELHGLDAAVLCFLNRDSLGHGRFLVRRLKRIRPDLRVGVVLWSEPEGEDPRAGDAAAGELAAELGADFVAFDMAGAAVGALSETEPVAYEPYPRRRPRRAAKLPDAPTAAAEP